MEKLRACILTPDHPPRALQRLGRVDRTELTDSETEAHQVQGMCPSVSPKVTELTNASWPRTQEFRFELQPLCSTWKPGRCRKQGSNPNQPCLFDT